MPRNWRFLSADQGRVTDLSRDLRVSPVLAQVLVARGYERPEAATTFLTTKLGDLHEPELLPGVSDAADRIVAALKAGRRITIYGDYDVDGVTSISLLTHVLKLAGAKVDYYIPHRLDEGYGLNSDALRTLHTEDPTRLVVTVDCGITAVKEALLCRELGLELIVTDHHQFAESLPEAACLVHPRLETGAYPFGDLCGVGVAFKLAWAICQRLGDGKKASPQMRTFLMSAVSLAALGTIADIVPLRGENRILVRYGLAGIKERCSLGMKALLQVSGLWDKPEIQAEDIAFALGPRLNAVGRLGQARLAVELLTTENPERAMTLAAYVDEQNKIRQKVERRIFKEAKEQIEARTDWLDAPGLVLGHHEWHAGVIGIVAGKVAEHFQKPTVLVAMNLSENIGQGSGRSFAGANLHAGLTACAEHLETFGGHHAAVGLKVRGDKLDPFREAFCSYLAENHEVNERDREVLIDTEVLLGDLTQRAVTELDRLGPFGCENPRPVFACSGVELAEPPRKMGEGDRHLSLMLKQHGKKMKAVCFGKGDWAEEIARHRFLSFCFAPTLNHFRGQTSVNLHLIDWKPEGENRESVQATPIASEV